MNTSYILLLIPLALIDIALIVVGLVDWTKRKRFRFLSRWVWLVIIIVLGTIGPILYLAIGRAEERGEDDVDQM